MLMAESKVAAKSEFADWIAARKGGVAITGASGWIGSAVVDWLLQALPTPDAIPLRLFGSAARTLRIGARSLAVESLSQAEPLGEGEWLVLHLAVVGADRLGADPERLRSANDAVLSQALSLARSGAVRRFVYASSGAVYQSGGSAQKRAYSEMKRAQEGVVEAWAAEVGAPLLIPRIFNVGGPYINHAGNYALGSFIEQALRTGVIEIQARQSVLRSYVHLFEFAPVLFDLAVGDDSGLVFDTAGAEVVEMADLARAVGTALGLDLEIRRPPLSPGEDRYVGDGRIYRAAVSRDGGEPIGLDRIVRDTADYLRGLKPAS
jgi:nucleoside-diphosphate-sugar epimerase